MHSKNKKTDSQLNVEILKLPAKFIFFTVPNVIREVSVVTYPWSLSLFFRGGRSPARGKVLPRSGQARSAPDLAASAHTQHTHTTRKGKVKVTSVLTGEKMVAESRAQWLSTRFD